MDLVFMGGIALFWAAAAALVAGLDRMQPPRGDRPQGDRP